MLLLPFEQDWVCTNHDSAGLGVHRAEHINPVPIELRRHVVSSVAADNWVIHLRAVLTEL